MDSAHMDGTERSLPTISETLGIRVMRSEGERRVWDLQEALEERF